MPQNVETAKIASRKVSATVVALTGSTLRYKSAIAMTMPKAAGNCRMRYRSASAPRHSIVAFRGAAKENKPVTKTPEEWLAVTTPPEKTKGVLKLFLGYAPGVGKTYSMLTEAIRRHSRGEDVVIGVVETHGRKGIAELVPQLEAVPRKKIEYKGTLFEEMDVDAIIARHPPVVLVDELAHTNIPGSKHRKRYEDVLELLDANIDVLSTVISSTSKASLPP